MTSAAPSCCYCGNAAASRAAPSYPSSSSSSSSPPRPPHKDLLSCQPCATRKLASQIVRYRASMERREIAREDCARRLLKTRPMPRRRRIRDGDYFGTCDDDDDEYDENDEDEYDSRLGEGGGGRKGTTTLSLPDPNMIHKRVSMLRRHLDDLRDVGNDLALRVASRTVENDEREGIMGSHSERVRIGRIRLERMRACLLDGGSGDDGAMGDGNGNGNSVGGGLRDALHSGTQEIQMLRFRLACMVFDMHRLDVGDQYSDDDGDDGGGAGRRDTDRDAKFGKECATGVGKIGGLPLPHAGPVLYGVIPPAVLASSLRLVASLTQLVARCLGVVLPHPILVCIEECRACGSMYDYGGDVIDDVSRDVDGRDGYGDEDDDDDDNDDGLYLGGDDDNRRRSLCGACLNEGMSRNSNMYGPMQQRPTRSSTAHPPPEKGRSSFLAIVGSSVVRRVVSLTTSATSRALANVPVLSPGNDPPSDRGPPTNAPPAGDGNDNDDDDDDDPPPSDVRSTHAGFMSPHSISRRVDRSTFAYLRENRDASATEYVLNPPRWGDDATCARGGGGDGIESNAACQGVGENAADGRPPTTRTTHSDRERFCDAEERFATGLQLLQNDIVALCFRAGVDVSALWPAESVLLNLHSLCRHCRRMADGGNIN
jgi:hypothetical protein